MISTLTTNEERDCKPELDENKVWKPREATLLQSNKIYSIIMVEMDIGIMEEMHELSRTELDSHANMLVIGKMHMEYILSIIGETMDVAPFTADYKPIRVELVDAALKYECPYSGEPKILIIRRGLHVPNRKKSKGHSTQSQKSHNVGTRLFSGFLVSFASGVVEWNRWMKQQSNTQKQGALTAIQTGCLGALHGSQSLAALHR